jgi:Zn-finger nucleic acid-binding protein
MNCPSCGAGMRLNADQDCLKCEYCKNIFFPAQNDDGVGVLGVPAEEQCPICAVPLMHAALAKIRILYCTKCRGMLIPMDVFMPLVEELRAGQQGTMITPPPDSHDLQRHSSCPRCHQPMETHYYAGPGNVIIDDCSKCQLNWFDHGELMRVVRAPDYSHIKPQDAFRFS